MSRPLLASALIVVAAGVLLPVGIVSWRAVIAPSEQPPVPAHNAALLSAADRHIARGDSAFGEDRFVDALSAYSRARALAPSHAPAHERVSRARVALAAAQPGRIGAEAADELRYEASVLLETAPERARLWRVGLANALATAGRLNAAEKLLRQTVAEESGDVYAHTALGLLLLRRGDQRSAGRAQLEAAAVLAPDHVPALLPLSQLALADGDRSRARTLLEQILSQVEDPSARQLLKAAQAAPATPRAPAATRQRPAPRQEERRPQ